MFKKWKDKMYEREAQAALRGSVIISEAVRERDEALIRLYGALWLLVDQEVINESRARELADCTPEQFRWQLVRMANRECKGGKESAHLIAVLKRAADEISHFRADLYYRETPTDYNDYIEELDTLIADCERAIARAEGCSDE